MKQARQIEIIKIDFPRAQTRISDIEDIAAELREEVIGLSKYDPRKDQLLNILSNLRAERDMLCALLGYHQTENGSWTV